MNHHHNLSFAETEGGGRLFIEYLLHDFNFQKVVAGPQRAELLPAPFERPGRHLLRVRSSEAPSVLRRFQVLRGAETGPHRPAGPFLEHFFLILAGQADIAGGPHTRGNAPVQGGGEILDAVPDVVERQLGRHQAAAAVDVVAHAAGRNDARLQIESRHAADGKSVSPVNIRHGEREIDDAGQMGNVGHLPGAFVFGQQAGRFNARVNDARHAHGAGLRHQPAVVVQFFQFDFLHGPLSPTNLFQRSGFRCLSKHQK